ncbi:MAG: bile acid:sodium symporter [Litoreibacter sp.]
MGILVSVVLPLGLAFIMLSLGVGLQPADFVRVVQRPIAFFIGALHQVVALPVIAYIVILTFGLTGETAVGIMILAACPGGVTSNILSKLAKGDVALSVSLTAVVSLVSTITVPVILTFALAQFMGADAPPINIVSTAIMMFLLTAVPIVLGLSLRALMPAKMMAAEPILAKIATVLFIIIVVVALAANFDAFIENLLILGPALVTLVVVLTAVGYGVPSLLGRSRHEAKTVSVETGVQNSALGIAIAAIIVGGGAGFSPFALPSAVYGIVMYLVILPIVLVYRRIN